MYYCRCYFFFFFFCIIFNNILLLLFACCNAVHIIIYICHLPSYTVTMSGEWGPSSGTGDGAAPSSRSSEEKKCDIKETTSKRSDPPAEDLMANRFSDLPKPSPKVSTASHTPFMGSGGLHREEDLTEKTGSTLVTSGRESLQKDFGFSVDARADIQSPIGVKLYRPPHTRENDKARLSPPAISPKHSKKHPVTVEEDKQSQIPLQSTSSAVSPLHPTVPHVDTVHHADDEGKTKDANSVSAHSVTVVAPSDGASSSSPKKPTDHEEVREKKEQKEEGSDAGAHPRSALQPQSETSQKKTNSSSLLQNKQAVPKENLAPGVMHPSLQEPQVRAEVDQPKKPVEKPIVVQKKSEVGMSKKHTKKILKSLSTPLHVNPFQTSSPSPSQTTSGSVSPSQRHDKRSNAWIQTESIPLFPNTGDTPSSSASYNGRYDDASWIYSMDQKTTQIAQSSFLEMLPHYISACIDVTEAERRNRHKVYDEVLTVVKSKFGLKADARIYGSVVTDLALPFSDIDILVTGYHPVSPHEAIRILSAALLELDEPSLRSMKETLVKLESEALQEMERKKIRDHNFMPSDPVDDADAEAEARSRSQSPFLAPSAADSQLDMPPEEEDFVMPISPEKEQYLCSEELESAEKVYRDQIERDYSFSQLDHLEPLWAPISNISAPTDLSKGTTTDIAPVPILSKIGSVESFRGSERRGEDLGKSKPDTPRGDDKVQGGAGTKKLDDVSHNRNKSTEITPPRQSGRESPSPTTGQVKASASPNANLSTPQFVGATGTPSYYTYVPTLEGPIYNVQTITSARVPVIKITERRTNQRADITFGGGEHYRSLQMTRNLLEEFPNARPLIRFLKFCVARQGISEAAPGGVTSFTIYLMVKHVFNILLDFLTKQFQTGDQAKGLHQGDNGESDGKNNGEPDNVDAFARSCLGSKNSEDSADGATPDDTKTDQASARRHAQLSEESSMGSAPNPKSGGEGTSSAYSQMAVNHIREQVPLTTIFRDFCYYYGFFFNYESQGIRFSVDGRSEVVPKPYQCARRGQLFHLTSPFDQEYDITARMTCMRQFQYMCYVFYSVVIPSSNFHYFLQWFSPQTARLELIAVRNFVLGQQVLRVDGPDGAPRADAGGRADHPFASAQDHGLESKKEKRVADKATSPAPAEMPSAAKCESTTAPQASEPGVSHSNSSVHSKRREKSPSPPNSDFRDNVNAKEFGEGNIRRSSAAYHAAASTAVGPVGLVSMGRVHPASAPGSAVSYQVGAADPYRAGMSPSAAHYGLHGAAVTSPNGSVAVLPASTFSLRGHQQHAASPNAVAMNYPIAFHDPGYTFSHPLAAGGESGSSMALSTGSNGYRSPNAAGGWFPSPNGVKQPPPLSYAAKATGEEKQSMHASGASGDNAYLRKTPSSSTRSLKKSLSKESKNGESTEPVMTDKTKGKLGRMSVTDPKSTTESNWISDPLGKSRPSPIPEKLVESTATPIPKE